LHRGGCIVLAQLDGLWAVVMPRPDDYRDAVGRWLEGIAELIFKPPSYVDN